MSKSAEEAKTIFRRRQRNLPVEEKIKQLYAMQERYLQISAEAIRQGLKKNSAEFQRACRLTGKGFTNSVK
jgi:hypothetical protein